MKANELRIGNWVNFLSNPIKIEGVTNRLRPNCGYYHFEGFKNPMKGIHVSPIELNEEWLLKFGFNSDEITFELNGFMLGWFKNNEFYYLPTNQISFRNKIQIKYLHQLQNLYFAITGNELSVTRI